MSIPFVFTDDKKWQCKTINSENGDDRQEKRRLTTITFTVLTLILILYHMVRSDGAD